MSSEQTKTVMTGNEAAAAAAKLARVQVIAAYPITPQSPVVEQLSEWVESGELPAEFVTVESEHSAMSAVIGSAAGGARTMTATSSQGFALMWEVLFVAASYRLPIVMTTVNRALSGPINIHCDHSDTMGGRDTGWIQLYGENHQEAYDNCIQAVRIAEHMDVRTPTMQMYDGYVISGAIGPLQMLTKEQVQAFIGTYHAINPMLDTKHPVTVGPFDGLHGWYFEHKVAQNRAMDRALTVIQDVADEYAEISGRQYGLIDPYRLEDAEIAIVVVGSTAGTTRVAVDKLRASLPAGYSIEEGGAVAESDKGNSSVFTVLPVTLVLMLLLLMLQLRRYSRMLLALLMAPFGLPGIVLAMLPGGTPMARPTGTMALMAAACELTSLDTNNSASAKVQG